MSLKKYSNSNFFKALIGTIINTESDERDWNSNPSRYSNKENPIGTPEDANKEGEKKVIKKKKRVEISNIVPKTIESNDRSVIEWEKLKTDYARKIEKSVQNEKMRKIMKKRLEISSKKKENGKNSEIFDKNSEKSTKKSINNPKIAPNCEMFKAKKENELIDLAESEEIIDVEEFCRKRAKTKTKRKRKFKRKHFGEFRAENMMNYNMFNIETDELFHNGPILDENSQNAKNSQNFFDKNENSDENSF